jgi:hypothetical protein
METLLDVLALPIIGATILGAMAYVAVAWLRRKNSRALTLVQLKADNEKALKRRTN